MTVLVVHQWIFRLINPLLYKSFHGDRLFLVITVKIIWLNIKRVLVVVVFRLNYVTTLTVLSGNRSNTCLHREEEIIGCSALLLQGTKLNYTG